jgi:hypothetical protein
MGIFDLFKKPLILQDELFGPLTYIKAKDPSKSYFMGSGVFAPTNDEIELYIFTYENGPSQAEREFYKTVENSYDSLITMMIPLVEIELKKQGESHKVKNFKDEFKVRELTIPALNKKPFHWEITFEVIPGDIDELIVEFEDFRPVRVRLIE